MSIYKQHYKKNIRNIAFRFDADESIGFGHLIRVKGLYIETVIILISLY